MSCPQVVTVVARTGPAVVKIAKPEGPAVIKITTPGPPGPSSSSYVFTAATPAAIWTINHNLGFKPAVELCNSGSQEIDGDVVHTSLNQTVVTFTTAVAGFARLN